MVQGGGRRVRGTHRSERRKTFRGTSFLLESSEVTEMQCVIPLGVYVPQGSKCLALNAKLPQILARAGIPATRKQGVKSPY